ncbi:MAG: hypothetical protein ABH821_01180 [archaeon]
MARKPKIGPSKRQFIKSNCATLTLRELAKELDVSITTAHKELKNQGLKRTRAQETIIRNCITKGITSAEEISAKLKITPQQLKRILRRQALKGLRNLIAFNQINPAYLTIPEEFALTRTELSVLKLIKETGSHKKTGEKLGRSKAAVFETIKRLLQRQQDFERDMSNPRVLTQIINRINTGHLRSFSRTVITTFSKSLQQVLEQKYGSGSRGIKRISYNKTIEKALKLTADTLNSNKKYPKVKMTPEKVKRFLRSLYRQELKRKH